MKGNEPTCLQTLKEMTFSLPSSHNTATYMHSRMVTTAGRSPFRRELQRIRAVVRYNAASATSSGGMAVPERNLAASLLKSFHCHLCPKRFARKHVLENHIRTHTGERPFQCPSCQKDFARKDYLNYHVRQCRLRRARLPAANSHTNSVYDECS
ncbi:uncharacterized protein LOC142787113 [Rhipicephalus microplus]|uniref:uncharacterized protein LOC142787113 n=1 Tax=Rhipicephalus microplus TaxID=6941 RepID=UPI003F6A7AED